MSTPLTIGKILFGPLYQKQFADMPNVVQPVIDVIVIACTGGFFKRPFLAFGLSEDVVIANWEQEPEKWAKIDPMS